MTIKKSDILDLVRRETADFLATHGLELYHVDFLKEGKEWHLDVYIDIAEAVREESAAAAGQEDAADRYVSTDDCELVSNYLSERLDALDPIEQNYVLEVSSPGLDRELYEQKDFDRFAGELVDVKLYRKVDGKKEYQGTLVSLRNGDPGEDPSGDDGKASEKILTIKTDDKDMTFAMSDVAKVSLAVVF